MRYSLVATALLASSTVTLALPTNIFSWADRVQQPAVALSLPSVAQKVINSVEGWMGKAGNDVNQAEDELSEGLSVERMTQEGITYDVLTHPAHPKYRLRVTAESADKNKGSHTPTHPEICDPNVKQISGYLDISDNKHLFFWFFESRNKPESDPLMLWLNGGPGCSSTTGLLFELGPCSITAVSPKGDGVNTTYNPHSWTEAANLIFLDQPVNVGFSYADQGSVDNSPAAAEDVYAFLTLFASRFSKYRKADFHVAGESYAGTYIPNIAHVIHSQNKLQSAAASSGVAPLPHLNLKSVMIGNGLTEPAAQFASVPTYACDSEYALYKDPQGPECQNLRSKMARCEKLIEACYRTNSKFVCLPAALSCWSGFGQLQDLGLNMYDQRKKCDRSEDADGPLCYRQMSWIETYMNSEPVKKQLGAPSSVTFKSCNMDINKAFLFNADVVHKSSDLLIPIIEDGIRTLIYSGVEDMMCNFIGNENWVDALQSSYQAAFLNSTAKPFIDSDGHESGYVRSAGEGSGNLAYVAIYEAGHMVPLDQPVASLDLVQRWLKNEPLAKGK